MSNNLTITPKSEFSTGFYENSDPIELFTHASSAEKELVISAVYRHVLGNAHLMESDRLTTAESKLKQYQISVREFVRTIAKSELYKSRFIDNCPRYRSHELNFKHLLGRAPDSYQETLTHSQILDSQGYEADIDSYIDSDEYQEAFGENIVPYYRGYKTQTGKRLLGYTNMFKMRQSISTSDKAGKLGNLPRLVKPIIYNNPSGSVPVTDVNSLLQKVLQPQVQFQSTTPQFVPYVPTSQPENESKTLEVQIAELEAELAALRSSASIGAAGVSRWQSYYVDLDNIAPSSRQFLTQQERLESLKQQIAQAKSLAALGEARLNKWRSRVFY
ncbi:MAG: phycobilisome rod-core linker polypeptide [Cyanobacteria bacterium P01_A01_bin.40]